MQSPNPNSETRPAGTATSAEKLETLRLQFLQRRYRLDPDRARIVASLHFREART